MSQSNTRTGDIVVTAGEDLTNQEGRVVVLGNNNGNPQITLPTSGNDVALYALIDGAANGENATARPLSGERNIRLRLRGNCQPGAQLVLADPIVAEDAGMVRPVPGGSGVYRVFAIAEEAGVDGQLVLVRPHAYGEVEVI